MKLRFVKFLTSRENEIEEQEDVDEITVSTIPGPAAPRACPPSSSSHHHPALFPSLPSCPSTASACPPPRVGRAMSSSYPLPSHPASPFLLHKIPEATERGGKDRGVVPSLPAQLFYSTITRRAPSSPATLAPSSNRVAAARPGPNDIFSAAEGTIGKQRPGMNYPISSPSLTNK